MSVRSLARTTPGQYRLWSAAAAVLLLGAAVVGTIDVVRMGSVTERTRRNTGPVLVAAQDLVASMAEADAAATAAFMSGRDEDREQRRLYEQALGRSHALVEDIASLAGDHPRVHEALDSVLVELSRYTGLVETARASLRGGLPAAEQPLVEAIGVLQATVNHHIGDLAREMQAQFDEAEQTRVLGLDIAAGLAFLVVVTLVAAQLLLIERTRRLINLPLLLATLVALGTAGWLSLADTRSTRHLDDARRDSFYALALTARIQATGHSTKTAESLAIVTGDPARRAQADEAAAQISNVYLTLAGQQADSGREQATVMEMRTRWQRYLTAVAQLRAARTPAEARTLAIGPVSTSFNGFNYSVESVLADNRDQFARRLADADDAVRGLRAGAGALLLLATLAALLGFQLRINEYR